ncbi:MAG: hypothetical protein ACFHX7_00255 [Pseudomonadota bacterium]
MSVEYIKGVMLKGGAFVGGDVYAEGKIDGLYQSAEFCFGGCIGGVWDYQGSYSISVKIVYPIAFGGGVSGGYIRRSEDIYDLLKTIGE